MGVVLDQGKLKVIDSRTEQSYTLPINESAVRAIGLRQIRQDPGEFGMLSYDPGYINTAACTSRIGYVDGANGILRYRGYPIEQLAQSCSFTEVAYLLLKGDLPTRRELEAWDRSILSRAAVPDSVKRIIDAFPSDSHPMGILVSAVAALSAHYPEGKDIGSRSNRRRQQLRLLGKMVTICAYIYRKTHSLGFPDPVSGLSYAGNFIHMLWAGTSSERTGRDARTLARAIDKLLVLHAEHEQNCSTSAMRHVASSNADPYASAAAAIAALSGPMHGGANEAVLVMLDEIADAANIPGFMRQVKAGNRRLMGFGHRVYKHYDPRARIIREIASEVFSVTGRNPKIDLAMQLESIALEDEYFIRRRLYPNVDFYSGIIYEAMGFPSDMFTVLFALGRMAGWLAHWDEFMQDPERRIVRPRQIYSGPEKRDLVLIDERFSR